MLRFINESAHSFIKQGDRIGVGLVGETYINKYVGQNDSLQQIAATNPNNCLVVKEISKPSNDSPIMVAMRKLVIANEISIVAILYDIAQSVPTPYFARGAVVKTQNEEEDEFIISELIAYTHGKDGKPISASVAQFMNQLVATSALLFNRNRENEHQALHRAFPQLLADFAEGIHRAQNELHDHGILHGDTALRNFMVGRPVCLDNGQVIFTLRTIDFGLSRQLSPEGVFHFLLTQSNPTHFFPWYMMDTHALNLQQNPLQSSQYVMELSIHTDYFAKKVALMELLCSALGEYFDVMCKDYFNKSSRVNVTDEVVLKHYLSELKKLSEKLLASDIRRDILTMFTTDFGDYLTTMPNREQTIAEIRANDDLSFQAALTSFRSKLGHQFGAHDVLRALMPASDLLPEPVLNKDAMATDGPPLVIYKDENDNDIESPHVAGSIFNYTEKPAEQSSAESTAHRKPPVIGTKRK